LLDAHDAEYAYIALMIVLDEIKLGRRVFGKVRGKY
jgi:hypothetical protein